MQLLLIGSIAMDRIMSFPGHFAKVIQPDKLHVLSVSLLLSGVKDTRGGVAANIAYNLALMGDHPVLYGIVGEDAHGYMKDLESMGVLTNLVKYSTLPTASFTVMTDQDDCQIGGFNPGAMGDTQELNLRDFSNSDTFIVMSPHDPVAMAQQIQEIHKHQFRMFYDIGQQSSNVTVEDLKNGIEAAELLIVNDYEMGVIEKRTNWTREEILKKVKVCVITLGEKGSMIYSINQELQIQAMVTQNIIDPTGAGDAYRAGFLYGYMRNWPLKDCGQLGSVVASCALQSIGTQEHHFDTKKLQSMYQKTYQTPIYFV